jgi:hypothetical protein
MQRLNLFAILLGRVLHIQDSSETGEAIEKEVQHIAETVIDCIRTEPPGEGREVALDVLRFLPARSANEITFVGHQLETAMDGEVRKAYIDALQKADPKTPDARIALEEVGKRSSQDDVREVIEHARTKAPLVTALS